MAEKEDKTKKAKDEPTGVEPVSLSQDDIRELQSWLEAEQSDLTPSLTDDVSPAAEEASMKGRLDRIRQSHARLRQFTPKELKILMNLKRNTSPKAWTLREDLVVLTLNLSNREIAEILKDRNKEAVKKRLQLLRSKGLRKRESDSSTPPA